MLNANKNAITYKVFQKYCIPVSVNVSFILGTEFLFVKYLVQNILWCFMLLFYKCKFYFVQSVC